MLAKDISALRKHLNLTQEELARILEDRLGLRPKSIPGQMVSRWEAGKILPRLSYRRGLAEIARLKGRPDLAILLPVDAKGWRLLVECWELAINARELAA